MDVDKIIADTESYNKDVSQWVYRVRSILKRDIQGSATSGNGVLAASLRSNIHKDMGEVDYVGYKFPRHGVFFHKGVGRGHVMSAGKVVRGVKNNKVIKPLDGPINRQSQDWFNSTLEKQIPKLADIVADHKADEAAVNAAGMKIH
ncbi:hypothetical protein E9993_14590 [Labilibacter sediminis]|nr:hypothetical protein E9993_14590 [Labilibacter sediminis]